MPLAESSHALRPRPASKSKPPAAPRKPAASSSTSLAPNQSPAAGASAVSRSTNPFTQPELLELGSKFLLEKAPPRTSIQCAWNGSCGVEISEPLGANIARHLADAHGVPVRAAAGGETTTCLWHNAPASEPESGTRRRRLTKSAAGGLCIITLKVTSMSEHILNCHEKAKTGTCRLCGGVVLRTDPANMHRHLKTCVSRIARTKDIDAALLAKSVRVVRDAQGAASFEWVDGRPAPTDSIGTGTGMGASSAPTATKRPDRRGPTSVSTAVSQATTSSSTSLPPSSFTSLPPNPLPAAAAPDGSRSAEPFSAAELLELGDRFLLALAPRRTSMQCAWNGSCGVEISEPLWSNVVKHLAGAHGVPVPTAAGGEKTTCLWHNAPASEPESGTGRRRLTKSAAGGLCANTLKIASLSEHILNCHEKAKTGTCRLCGGFISRAESKFMHNHLKRCVSRVARTKDINAALLAKGVRVVRDAQSAASFEFVDGQPAATASTGTDARTGTPSAPAATKRPDLRLPTSASAAASSTMISIPASLSSPPSDTSQANLARTVTAHNPAFDTERAETVKIKHLYRELCELVQSTARRLQVAEKENEHEDQEQEHRPPCASPLSMPAQPQPQTQLTSTTTSSAASSSTTSSSSASSHTHGWTVSAHRTLSAFADVHSSLNNALYRRAAALDLLYPDADQPAAATQADAPLDARLAPLQRDTLVALASIEEPPRAAFVRHGPDGSGTTQQQQKALRALLRALLNLSPSFLNAASAEPNTPSTDTPSGSDMASPDPPANVGTLRSAASEPVLRRRRRRRAVVGSDDDLSGEAEADEDAPQPRASPKRARRSLP